MRAIAIEKVRKEVKRRHPGFVRLIATKFERMHVELRSDDHGRHSGYMMPAFLWLQPLYG